MVNFVLNNVFNSIRIKELYENYQKKHKFALNICFDDCKNAVYENFNKLEFKDKINFGTLINTQSQNIISKNLKKQINAIKLISFQENKNKEEKNKNNDYILIIEENRIKINHLLLSPKVVARFC